MTYLEHKVNIWGAMSRRLLSLWLPRFASCRALRHAPVTGSFALVTRMRGADRICCLNQDAEARGVRQGMGLADARALCPDLLTRPANPAADTRALEALRRWAVRYCPWVASDGHDGLMLDITGAAHLVGGEEALTQDLTARLAQMGFEAHIAIADTRGAAWAVARFAGGGIVAEGKTAQALMPLPLAALRLDPETVDGLERLGLRILRDLTQVPRATLAHRFGTAPLQRLDQALGQMSDPLGPAAVPPVLAVRLSLPEPIGLLSDMEAALERLLERLCGHLRISGLGARKLHLELVRSDGKTLWLEIGLARPMRDPGPMAQLFNRALEGVDAGFGIEHMRLSAPEAESLPTEQITTSGAQAQDDLADLLTRLCNRIGFENVHRYLPADSHIPEKAYTIAAAAYSAPAGGWPEAPPRPLLIFRPEAISGTGRTVPPQFRWRGLHWKVIAASGPERITPEWWMDDPDWRTGLRDYWRIQTDRGARLWLYHTPQNDGWYVQGEFA